LTAVAYTSTIWGAEYPSPHLHGQITLAMGSGERHDALSTTYSWGAEYNSRTRIQSGEGQVKLDALSSSVSRIQPNSGPLEVNLVTLRLTHQLPQFFSWRPDPQASSRCLSTRLEPVEGVCQSSVVSCVEQGEVIRCSTSPSGSSV